LILCYLIGSIPFGFLIGLIFYKVDIRTVGSKNPGATNVWRLFGKYPGIATLLLDTVKGLIPILLIKHFFPSDHLMAILAGLALISGHNWSLVLKGKGGKGVATSAGVFLALIPLHAFISLLFFLFFFLTTRHVSVGSMSAAIALFGSTYIFETPPLIRYFVMLASLMVLLKHIPNMKRLIQGEEPEVSFR
ncbi:MAG: glycerol-3-phosphate 1-O-acyltransferase PlsY, partial [Elusimicrobia bacterium]|nr:glycerol-3-phosphate 1-O-acyltransferase PlsY [Candidatus Obscuribacterium magneticum]